MLFFGGKNDHNFHLNINSFHNKNVFEQQISILKWYVKDCVTVKTGVMTAENSALPTGINYITKYIKT